MLNANQLDFLFYALEGTRWCKQNPEHHPEIYVLEHSLQVMNLAFRETNDIDLILAAMMHDVGKLVDPYWHAKIASAVFRGYMSEKSLFLIENHMRIWDYLLGDMQRLSKCVWLANHQWLPELVQLARWDKKGRVPNKKTEYNRVEIVQRLRKAAGKHFVDIGE